MSLAHLGPISSYAHFASKDQAKDYTAHLVTKSKSSFTLGMKAMERPKREAIFAFYAFCRVVDDIADEAGDLSEKRDLLTAWHREVDRLYEGEPHSLIGHALLDPIRLFNIPKQEFTLMIEGMETDVNGPVVAPSMEELLRYTRRVAGTVGMASIRIFGVSDHPSRDPFALNLADALQLTNILRDVEEDADIGRLYLPNDLLKKHGITDITPAHVTGHPSLVSVCRDLGVIARERFNEARRELANLKGEPVRPALMMMGVYEAYLDRMEQAGFTRNPTVHKLSKWQKLGHGLRYAYAFPKRHLPAPAAVPPLASIEG